MLSADSRWIRELPEGRIDQVALAASRQSDDQKLGEKTRRQAPTRLTPHR